MKYFTNYYTPPCPTAPPCPQLWPSPPAMGPVQSGPVEIKCHLSFYHNMPPLASIWYSRDGVREVERKLVASVTGFPRLDYTQDCSGNLKLYRSVMYT